MQFDIDADGILNVAAKDMASQRSALIRITGSTRLPDADKQRMIDQAQQYAEQDKKRREDAEKLNTADFLCYQAERTLADFVGEACRRPARRVETALRETREALGKRDAAARCKSGCVEDRAAGSRAEPLRPGAAARSAAAPRRRRADRRGAPVRARSRRAGRRRRIPRDGRRRRALRSDS